MKLSNIVTVACSTLLVFFCSTSMVEASSSKDGEIVACVMAIDKHEIKAADAALKKDVDASVSDYSKMLSADHQKNMQDLQQLSDSLKIAPVKTPEVKAFEKKGDKKLASLSEMKGHKFEMAYMDAMVKGHEEALTKLNKDIKKVKNDSLKDFLVATRDTVKGHLEEAKKIEKDLNKA